MNYIIIKMNQKLLQLFEIYLKIPVKNNKNKINCNLPAKNDRII